MTKFRIYLLYTFCILFLPFTGSAMNLHREIVLEGEWKFEIGDKEEFSSPNYDDSRWENINVPNSWENEGFPGYDGYAWYRIAFRIDNNLRNKQLYLKLGRIDDTDMVYLNGHYIGGEGQFPPNYQTAWDVVRLYRLPVSVINYSGRNVLSVRVYDLQGSGGIYRDEVGIFSRLDVVDLALDLSGKWKFRPGDNKEWAKANYDDESWSEIKVPSYWEHVGYVNLDGIAWYRKDVEINKKLARQKLILLLGKINDMDQVFFNGTLIGNTGIFPKLERDQDFESLKNIYRAYFIPPDLIIPGAVNAIAVRVLDLGWKGGIYEEYIGIVKREEYLKYIKTIK